MGSEFDGSAWPKGTVVSLSRLAGRGQAMARALGLGALVDGVDVGCTLRVRLDSGRALEVSAIEGIEVVDDATLRIETANHRYEMRRVAGGAPSPEGTPSMFDRSGRSADPEATGVIHYEPELDARPGVFEEGSRVHVVQLDRDERIDLGSCRLLGGLAPGEPLGIATPGGVVSTSPVAKIRRCDDGSVEVSTANRSYRLTLEPAEGGVGEGAEA